MIVTTQLICLGVQWFYDKAVRYVKVKGNILI